MPAAAVIPALASLVGTGVAYSQSRSAEKSAKSSTDTQMRMADESQKALVAKEKAAKDELAAGQAKVASQAAATATSKKRAIARSETVYTSPLGIGGTADVARKVLLGQ